MCGIAGWVSYDGVIPSRRDVLLRMTETLAQRGPDGSGLWIDRFVGFGHRRLAVIDAVGGVQPMLAQEDGQTLAALIYNGEIYNFVELRRLLVQQGHNFRTKSDTEVLLRGYLQWGEGIAERLNGMFAFAIWDVRTEELILVRDQMGIKPLFFYQTAQGVVFGSEPKAILAHPDIRQYVDSDGLREVLGLVKNPERTVFAGMYEVRPGQIVRISRRGLTKRQYWELQARPHEHNLKDTILTVSQLLEDIVTRQLVSDVPLCTLLSGGLDSSSITALARRAIKIDRDSLISTYSLGFANHDQHFVPNAVEIASDTPFIRDFIAHSPTDHTEVTLEGVELADKNLTQTVLRATDFPLCLPPDQQASLYRLLQAVRAKSTVALSGEGADEVFGGYGWFHQPNFVNAETFPWLAAASDLFSNTSVFNSGLLADLHFDEFLADSYAKALAEVPISHDDDAVDRRMRQISYFHLTRWMQVLLDRKDRISMALGLEIRVPFCDHRLVDYVFNIPWRMKTFDGREKSLLRAAMQPLLPVSVTERRKVPYPAVHDPKYERVVRTQVAEIIKDTSHPARDLFDVGIIEDMLEKPLGTDSTVQGRTGLERVRVMSAWIKDRDISLVL